MSKFLCTLLPGMLTKIFFNRKCCYSIEKCYQWYFCAQIKGGGRGSGNSIPPKKSGVALDFLRNTAMYPLKKRSDPRGPIATGERYAWLFVKYADD